MKDKQTIKNLYLSIEEELNQYIFSLDSYQNIVCKRTETEKLLESVLGKNNYEIFDHYISIESEIEVLEMQESFIKGFSMACKLLFESINKDSPISLKDGQIQNNN